jgi:elongation factor P
MDNESYEQIPVGKDIISQCRFELIKENTSCKILSYKGGVFGIEPPTFVELLVTETEPGVRGDTATNVTKPATVETGAVVKVPLFVDAGDMLRIDTRTGEYLERARN